MSVPDLPPARLSSRVGYKDFHPGFMRVGVKLDGQERLDVVRYDQPAGRVWTKGGKELVGRVDPF